MCKSHIEQVWGQNEYHITQSEPWPLAEVFYWWWCLKRGVLQGPDRCSCDNKVFYNVASGHHTAQMQTLFHLEPICDLSMTKRVWVCICLYKNRMWTDVLSRWKSRFLVQCVLDTGTLCLKVVRLLHPIESEKWLSFEASLMGKHTGCVCVCQPKLQKWPCATFGTCL